MFRVTCSKINIENKDLSKLCQIHWNVIVAEIDWANCANQLSAFPDIQMDRSKTCIKVWPHTSLDKFNVQHL